MLHVKFYSPRRYFFLELVGVYACVCERESGGERETERDRESEREREREREGMLYFFVCLFAVVLLLFFSSLVAKRPLTHDQNCHKKPYKN